MTKNFSVLLLGLALIFSFSSSSAEAKVKEVKKKKEVSAKNVEKKGICEVLRDSGQPMSPAEKTLCFRAEIIKAKKASDEAKKGLIKLASPEEKDVLGQMTKEKKEVQRQRELSLKVLSDAALSGCDASDRVVIDASSRRDTLLSGILAPTYVSYRFHNDIKNQESVNIENTETGLLIKNLCPGGSVTVYRQFRTGIDQYGVTISGSFFFTGQKSKAYQSGPGYSLSPGQQYINTQPYNIVLPK